MEQEAEDLYNLVLEELIYPLVGKRVTFGRDLTKAGLKLFGMNYMGTFASDQIPHSLGKVPGTGKGATGTRWIDSANVSAKSPLYLITNLDDSNMPGSHWVALAYDIPDESLGKKQGLIWVYDSFGRKTGDILPQLAKQFGKNNLRMADDDAEQKLIEDDCGARCLAFLYIFDRHGSDVAKFI